MIKKFWVIAFLAERIIDIFIFILLFIATSSIIISIMPIIGSSLFDRLTLKPRDSTLYRLPLSKCDGVIAGKHAPKIPKNYFCREYIVFCYDGGETLKVYLAGSRTAKGRAIIKALNIGDIGTLHYRRGRKHLFFQEFEKLDSDLSESQNLDE